MLPIDIEALDPVHRMELADALYDSAMQAIESPAFTPEQLAELDRRLDRLHRGESTPEPWEEVRTRLMSGR